MAESEDTLLALDALRARGAERLDPTRWACTEALARRMTRWQGPVRQRLQARLARALASWHDDLDHAGQAASPVLANVAPMPPGAAALAELVRQWPRHEAEAAGGEAMRTEAMAELRALRRFRGEWARLRAEQRLAGALAQVPANAGPLHSAGLALRAVQLMRTLSPAYLQHLVVHADALLWLEAATGDDALPLPAPVRHGGDRRARPRKLR